METQLIQNWTSNSKIKTIIKKEQYLPNALDNAKSSINRNSVHIIAKHMGAGNVIHFLKQRRRGSIKQIGSKIYK